MNPLFPSTNSDDTQQPKPDPGYVLPRQKGKVQPLHTREELRAQAQPGFAAAAEPAASFAATEPDPQAKTHKSNPAVTLIRSKINNLYAAEPSASAELDEVVSQARPRSKHQQFMHDLSVSGRPLAEIQVAWHKYYTELPDHEKHEVWQEFYAANERQPSAYTQYVQKQQAIAQAQQRQAGGRREHASGQAAPVHEHLPHIILPGSAGAAGQAGNSSLTPAEALLARYEGRLSAENNTLAAGGAQPRNPIFGHQLSGSINPSAEQPALPVLPSKAARDKRSVEAIRRQVKSRVRAANDRVPAQARRQLKSLLFGLSMGMLVLLVFLFGFFNEVIIAPFIQPSRHASATPIILTSQDLAPGAGPEVIIPKINVEIPVDYTQASSQESDIEGSLQNGIVHYPTTVLPGQKGNAAFFGHSSNNIFNPGKYKFAFVLLHTLVPGDIFYLTSNQKVYTYRVYEKKIVSPKEVSILNSVDGKAATATLITCDPPGTSLNRLVVWGEQVSPDPSANSESATTVATTQPTQLASNGPTLWSRLTHWITNW